ncbi:hypothetical protein BT08F33_39860 [Escherichia coli]
MTLSQDAVGTFCQHHITGTENIVTTNDTTHPAVFFIQCIHRRSGDAFDTFFFGFGNQPRIEPCT